MNVKAMSEHEIKKEMRQITAGRDDVPSDKIPRYRDLWDELLLRLGDSDEFHDFINDITCKLENRRDE